MKSALVVPRVAGVTGSSATSPEDKFPIQTFRKDALGRLLAFLNHIPIWISRFRHHSYQWDLSPTLSCVFCSGADCQET